MSISKFKQWLDVVDPYALQRITLYKCLFVATVEVYVYWIFLPNSFVTFFAPFFILSLYESPLLTSFKEKEQFIIFVTIATILITLSYYLVYPFRGVFLFFSTFVLAITYYFVLKYFYAIKNMTMLLIAGGSVILSSDKSPNFEVAYGLVSATALSMIFAFICLKIFPNQYLIVWNKALQKFIQNLENDIDCAIKMLPMSATSEQLMHLGIARSYRRMIPKKYIMQTTRIGVNLRNIQLALSNLYYEKKNEEFWDEIKNNLNWLRHKMATYSPCGIPKVSIVPETKLQHYVLNCLQKAYLRWNKLCSLQKH